MEKLKTECTRSFSNFRLSGQQDGEQMYDSWCNFASTDVLKYAISILTYGDFDNLGKEIPVAVGRDTGALLDDEQLKAQREKYKLDKRKQRDAKKARLNDRSADPTSVSPLDSV